MAPQEPVSALLAEAHRLAGEHIPAAVVAQAERSVIPMLGVNLWRDGFAAGYRLAAEQPPDVARLLQEQHRQMEAELLDARAGALNKTLALIAVAACAAAGIGSFMALLTWLQRSAG